MFGETHTDTERANRLLENIENDLRSLRQLLGATHPQSSGGTPFYYNPSQSNTEAEAIEGIFDGEKMVDTEGKAYQVSANYASKSKLIEGDPLKLYITSDGKFFYKQLGPVERKTVPGVLRADGARYLVDTEDGRSYNVLTASVTYFMSLYGTKAGDRLMLLIPAEGTASWGVIENML